MIYCNILHYLFSNTVVAVNFDALSLHDALPILRCKILLMTFANTEEINPCLFSQLGQLNDFLNTLLSGNAFFFMWIREMIPKCIDAEFESFTWIYSIFHVISLSIETYVNPILLRKTLIGFILMYINMLLIG